MKKNGYTFIEIMIAVTLALLVAGGGIAAYINLNDKQTLVTNGKQVQILMRTAQTKARSGDKPSGCVKLLSYIVSIPGPSYNTVVLSAECSNTTYQVSSYTFPNNVQGSGAISMHFLVLQGGVTGSGNVSIIYKARQYAFTVNPGGDITEGVVSSYP